MRCFWKEKKEIWMSERVPLFKMKRGVMFYYKV